MDAFFGPMYSLTAYDGIYVNMKYKTFFHCHGFKIIRKIVEGDKIDTHSKHIHDRLLSWIGQNYFGNANKKSLFFTETIP
jgi:hypothetical protein